MEDLVYARDFEAVGIFAVHCGQAVVSEVESEFGALSFQFDAFYFREVRLEFRLAVLLVESEVREPHSQRLLVHRMDVGEIVRGVVGQGHAGIGNIEGSRLGVDDLVAVGVDRDVMPGSDLNVVEGQVFAPELAPALNEGVHLLVVGFGAGTVDDVVLRLVPEEALDGEGNQRMDLRVVNGAVLVRRGVFGRLGRRRHYFAGFHGSFQFFRPLLALSVRVDKGSLIKLPLLFDVVDVAFHALHFFKAHGRDVRPDRRAAPGGVDDADWSVYFLHEAPGEEVADGAEAPEGSFAGSFRRADGPLGVDVEAGRIACLVDGGQDAEVRMVRVLDELIAVVAGFDAHLHVALPGAEPDFADKDVAYFYLFADGSFDRQGLRFESLRERSEPHHPGTVFVSGRFNSLVLENDGHLGARFRETPDGDRLSLLQDHVVADYFRQP